MEMIARKSGRLLKGGEPCTRTAAIMMINDYQRGRLPHYVAPPELKDEQESAAAKIDGIKGVSQHLGEVGEENMKDDGAPSDEAEEETDKNDEAEANEESKGAEEEESESDDSDEEDGGALIGAGEWADNN